MGQHGPLRGGCVLVAHQSQPHTARGGAVAARRAHNPKVVGSSPTPATKIRTQEGPRNSGGLCFGAMKQTIRKAAIAALILVWAVVSVFACGGSGASPTQQTTTPTSQNPTSIATPAPISTPTRDLTEIVRSAVQAALPPTATLADAEETVRSVLQQAREAGLTGDDMDSVISLAVKASMARVTPEPVQAPQPAATPMPTPRPTATPRPTPRPTATPRPTPRPTATPRPAPGPTATPRPTPRPTATPMPTPSGPTTESLEARSRALAHAFIDANWLEVYEFLHPATKAECSAREFEDRTSDDYGTARQMRSEIGADQETDIEVRFPLVEVSGDRGATVTAFYQDGRLLFEDEGQVVWEFVNSQWHLEKHSSDGDRRYWCRL